MRYARDPHATVTRCNAACVHELQYLTGLVVLGAAPTPLLLQPQNYIISVSAVIPWRALENYLRCAIYE